MSIGWVDEFGLDGSVFGKRGHGIREGIFRIAIMEHVGRQASGGSVNEDIVAYLRSLNPVARRKEVEALVANWLSSQSRFRVGGYTFTGATVVAIAVFFGFVLMEDEGGNRVVLEVEPSRLDLGEAYGQVPIGRGEVAGTACFFLINFGRL